MWTIKEAADRAGLSPDVLRAWERRYGVVRPTRTDSGYRLYSEADIGVLGAMRRLIEDGFKPREAADRLARDPGAVSVDGRQPYPLAVSGGAPAPEVGDTDGVGARLIAAAGALDTRALGRFFDELAASGSFETVCEERLFPAFRALGQAWADGSVSVAAEHAATAAALRWLGAQYHAAARDARPPQVIVALPAGSRHELGALAHAVALRRSGLDALYLGADLPEEDLVQALRSAGAHVLVVGVVTGSDVAAAERLAEAVKEASSEVRLAFGGRHAAELAAFGTVLPAGVRASAAAVRELV